MHAGFQLGVLLFAGLYSYYAFAELSWLSSAGRIGPAFFPRLIGVTLVVLTAWSLAAEWRGPAGGGRADGGEGANWRAAGLLALLSGLFVAGLDVLGGLVSMVLFMAAALTVFNRGRTLQNALLALLLPAGLYLLFKVWLNAGVPRGMFLPF
jgi:putative tricarboxylic transport membrane protein